MITQIELHNWRTHGDTTLHFQQGVNVLVGIMGAGKSSVIDAVSFALFGTFPALASRRVSLESMITNRPSEKPNAAIKLSFNVADDKYTVTRKVERAGTSTAKLEKNNTFLQAQPSKVTEEIESLLKLDYDTFCRAVYAEQNNINYFLDIAKSVRKKQIDQMLGLDNFAKAEESATSLINNIKAIISDEQQMLSAFDMDEMKSAAQALSNEHGALTSTQQQLQNDSSLKTKQAEQHRQQLDKIKKEYLASKILQNQIAALTSKSNTLREERSKVSIKADHIDKITQQIESNKIEKARVEGQISSSKTHIQQLTSALAAALENIKIYERSISERDRLTPLLDKNKPETVANELQGSKARLQQLDHLVAAHKARHDEINRQITELQKPTSKCPICERDLDAKHRSELLDAKNKALDLSIAAVVETSDLLDNLNGSIKALDELHTKLQLAKTRLEEFKDMDRLLADQQSSSKDLAEQLQEAKRNAVELDTQRDTIITSLNELSAAQQEITKARQIDAQILETDKQVQIARQQFSLLDVDEKQIYALQEQLANSQAAVAELVAKIESNGRYLSNLELQLKQKKEQIEKIDKIARSVSRKRSALNNLIKFKQALAATEAHLRSRLVEAINEVMGSMWGEMYPYTDYHAIRIAAKPDDYLLETRIGQDNEWVPLDVVASGGERSMASLAMRIAMSMVVVPNLRWLILDEPTHNIDANGIDKMITVLGDSLPKIIEQIFIITHDEELKQINNARVYLLERDKASYGATVVNQI